MRNNNQSLEEKKAELKGLVEQMSLPALEYFMKQFIKMRAQEKEAKS